jgi:hypothetical protein
MGLGKLVFIRAFRDFRMLKSYLCVNLCSSVADRRLSGFWGLTMGSITSIISIMLFKCVVSHRGIHLCEYVYGGQAEGTEKEVSWLELFSSVNSVGSVRKKRLYFFKETD